MNLTAMFTALLVILPAIGLLTWAWLSMAQVEEDLRAFGGFEWKHFEIGLQATASTEGARWPTPD